MIRELQDKAGDLAAEYVRQPSNFEDETHGERLAAHDGFVAGFEEGVKAGLAIAEGVAS